MNRIWHRLITGDTGLAGQGATQTGVIEGIVFGLLASNAVTFPLAGSAFAISAISGAVTLGLSVGLSYLSQSLFRPSQPKPEDGQQSVRQPTAPRSRHYGRVKVSGPWVFAETKHGDFHKVIALGQGPVDAIEEYWVDDHHVTLDGSGRVEQKPWAFVPDEHNQRLYIFSRLGAATETAYPGLINNFSQWTSEHRGDGVASLYARQEAVGQADFLSVFPNGINTNYRVVLRGARVKNPVTGTTAWNDNAAAVIRDYLTHADGMRLPENILTTPLAQAGWEEAYNRCDEDIALKGGGTEKRYRLWGSYRLDERPADVLGRMLSCCDGRLVPTSDGGLALDIGKWAEPSITIDEDAIVGFTDLGRGRDILTTANTIRATFMDPNQDYQAADADPWVDAADVSDRGEIAEDKQFHMAPSHSQCRRLMKLEAYRANPTWIATFRCNLLGLAAFGERFVRISYPKFGINSVFEVQDFKFDIGEGGILLGVTIQVQSMPQEAYEWDAAQEEGDAPVSDETTVDDSIPVPAAPTVNFQPGPVAELTFSPSSSVLLSYIVRYKKTADSTWTEAGPLDNDASSYTTGTLVDDEEYEFQLAFQTERGRNGDWSASTVATPNAIPDPVTGVSATGGAGTVDLSWTNPSDENFAEANIYRNTVDDEGTATLVHSEPGDPSQADSWQDTGLSAGDYYYWIRAKNNLNVESDSVATGAVTVT